MRNRNRRLVLDFLEDRALLTAASVGTTTHVVASVVHPLPQAHSTQPDVGASSHPGMVHATVEAAPVALSPGTSTSPGPVLTTTTPTFTWTALTDVAGYQINVYDTTSKKLNIFTTTGASDTSYTPAAGALAAGDAFVWNVRGIYGTATGPESNYLFFQTAAHAAPVALSPGTSTSPGPVLTTTTPTFTWTAVAGVSGYQINVYDSTLKKLDIFATGASVTSYTPATGVLAAGDTFVWNVRGIFGDTTGPESNYLFFQTAAHAAPVALTPGTAEAPGPVLTTLTPTFTWTAVAGVSGYQINVYDSTLKKLDIFSTGASVTSYTPAAGTFAHGDSFVWNVRGIFGDTTGPESNYLYFQTTAEAAPVALSPGTATSPGPVLTTTTPTFTWTAVPDVSGYQINVYDSTLKKLIVFSTGASVTSYMPTAGVLTAGDAFVWNVRGIYGETTGPESNYLYFQTTAHAAPVALTPGTSTSPGPVLTTTTPTFTWTAVPDVSGYQINVYDSTLKKLIIFTTGASATSYTPAAGVLAAGDAFIWNVRGIYGTTTGPESNYLYFQTRH